MKKLILICLVVPIAIGIPTSTLLAQVADSPGADFLHRSSPQVSTEQGGTHRGGETRSDTLSIGDRIPEGIEFTEVLHHDSDKLRLDDYRGKYVILEFWAPTCTASIASLPEMDAIQKKYGDRIAVLPITVFPEKPIVDLLDGYSFLEGIDLPLIVNEPSLRKSFPHVVIPHIVILDREGKIIAITGQEDLTEANLTALLEDGKVLFRTKEDTDIQLPKGDRLISGSPQLKNKNIWYQSAMTGYIPGVTGSLIQNFKGMSHIRIVNMELIYYYQLAYSERNLIDYFGRNRIDRIGFDPDELITEKMGLDYDEWKAEGTHVFGYELIAPPHVNAYQLMREDLKRFFPHIEASVEKKKKMVYAIVQAEGKPYPRSIGEKRDYKVGGGKVEMTNYPLEGFVYHMNAMFWSNKPEPLVDRTGIDYPIDLKLNVRLSDPESLRTALKENGLDLVRREEEIPVLVMRKISEPNLLAP
ncbi:TlpA disulfide reductase family protein [Algoriphagus sp. NG3]|uniref:TlpA family protein disulfide reductase n=1 Tax=Algoriphagus sp. NG3 TaxID=3097546 RepID=UPI002A823380|nr:TlpA disulfide reductase family protein [Algoriphagus sp. NG3]WPR77694.1 TlpA disulfide reductase family protein [Algoriphagus sp. NG3]